MVFFDPRGIERDATVEVLPAGEYIALIDKVKRVQDHRGLRHYVFLKIVAPKSLADKVVMDTFNIENSNADTGRIGKQQFAKLLDCIGLGNDVVQSENELHNKVVKVELDLEPHYKDPSKSQNRVKKYSVASSNDVDAINRKKPLPDPGEDLPF